MKIKDLVFLNRIFGKRELHVEAIHIDRFYRKLLDHLKRYRCVCYCLTPANYPFVKSTFGTGSLSKEDYSELLKKRYRHINQNRMAELQLHVHISEYPEEVSKEDKERLMTEAYGWFKENVRVPEKVVFGWYRYDKTCKAIAKSLGLEIVGQNLHTYPRWL